MANLSCNLLKYGAAFVAGSILTFLVFTPMRYTNADGKTVLDTWRGNVYNYYGEKVVKRESQPFDPDAFLRDRGINSKTQN